MAHIDVIDHLAGGEGTFAGTNGGIHSGGLFRGLFLITEFLDNTVHLTRARDISLYPRTLE